ncbi:hypothetical protein Pmani_028821 [Petrolisthes manimaculis]|uniref:Uncharacterized protein n=1 Tax=Petrolisthes manimaculis TaxID=1843537 RepID=A0AAE1P1H1_9EUCA|nr:hypothetical protein Pmani_028821 [Petrolisthes manimaculis]
MLPSTSTPYPLPRHQRILAFSTPILITSAPSTTNPHYPHHPFTFSTSIPHYNHTTSPTPSYTTTPPPQHHSLILHHTPTPTPQS